MSLITCRSITDHPRHKFHIRNKVVDNHLSRKYFQDMSDSEGVKASSGVRLIKSQLLAQVYGFKLILKQRDQDY